MSTLTLRGLVDQRPELPPDTIRDLLRAPPPKDPGHHHRASVKLSAEEAAGLFWWRYQSHKRRRCVALLLLNLEGGMPIEEAAAIYRRGDA
jgi:hypothetical protein